MGECNSIKHCFREAPNIYPNISNDQQFRLNKISEIKDYFIAEIRERVKELMKELMSKNLSKYIASFKYLDKSLIVLSVANGSISIALVATAIEAPVGMMRASCSLAFFIATGFVKNFFKNDKK